MDNVQRKDTRSVFIGINNAGLLDFVVAWYVKATHYMSTNSAIRTAFVSTNSITQGEQVGTLWGWLLSQGIKIHFAHRTFAWSNEARGNAAVHCVIIGFAVAEPLRRLLFEYGERFYNFRGLHSFKDKFEPVWEARYLTAPGGVAPLFVLADVATLISGGGVKRVISK